MRASAPPMPSPHAISPDSAEPVARIAIVEDEPGMAAKLKAAIDACEDLTVVGHAATCAAGEVMIDQGGYDILLCDLGLPDGDGLDLIRRAVKRDPAIAVIVVTMFGEQRKVIECIKAGARGYLLKDLEGAQCVDAIHAMLKGGAPISPAIARHLLQLVRPEEPLETVALSDREMDVLNVLARGFSKRESAEMLGLSVNTVNTHVKSIYRKLAVNSRAEAVYEATHQGLID
ncbi:MAG: response regulator transcription factor [Pontixanthobacter sp.]